MLALSENEYEVTLNDLKDFIDENNEERGFLNDWIAWWDRRREHFSKAYKTHRHQQRIFPNVIIRNTYVLKRSI